MRSRFVDEDDDEANDKQNEEEDAFPAPGVGLVSAISHQVTELM